MQAKAEEIADTVLFSSFEEYNNDDPVMEEARSIAKELIIAHSARETIPLPSPDKLVEIIDALITARQEIYERAEKRLEIRYKIALITLSLVQD